MSDRRRSVPRRRRGDRRISDRRAEPRQQYEAHVRFLRSGTSVDEVLPGELTDVSPGGIRLLLHDPVRTGERLLVEVRDENGHCFNLTAEVIWVEPAEDIHYRVGCELRVELPRRQFALLKRLAAVPSAGEIVP